MNMLERKISVIGLDPVPQNRVARSSAPPTEKRITLDQVKFRMVPEDLPLLPDEVEEDWDYQSVSDVYRKVYRLIYHDWPNTSIGKNWEAAVRNAAQAKMKFRSFVTFVIAGWKLTHPHTPFFTVNLTAPSAADNIESIREVCQERYNAEDAESLGLALDIVLEDIDEFMFLSEVSFGTWVLGCKLRNSGSAVESFYSSKELSQHRYWLAIETTYYTHVLDRWLLEHFGTEAEKKHRHLVCGDLGLFKRKLTLQSTLFNSRNRIMHKALKSVLLPHGLSPLDFTVPNKPVEKSFEFWNGLGLALQHFEAIKAVNGERHRLWR